MIALHWRRSVRLVPACSAFLAATAVAAVPQSHPTTVDAANAVDAGGCVDAAQQGADEFLRALDHALGETAASPARLAPAEPPSLNLGSARLQLLDLSLDVLSSVGASTERNDSLANLQLGDHDPNRRGFRLNQVELSILGAVDPYFRGEVHFIQTIEPDSGETAVELEEAFFTTTSLPQGLQLKGGMYFTEFGRINSVHPHAWDFVDQPVILSRVFGPDGMRGPGARLSWLTPLPWYTEVLFGAQNADGEQMASFLGNDELVPPGGHAIEPHDVRSLVDFAYSSRILQSFDLGDDVVTQLGFSGAWGPNAAGRDTRSSIYGADFQVKWLPAQNDAGWPFVVWQSEVARRTYGTSLQMLDPDGVPASGDEATVRGDTLRDRGLYSYLLWGFRRDWIAGFRYEQATASGAGLLPRNTDPLRDDRTRLSPLLVWQPTHFSRVSLQYNYDVADHLVHDDAQSAWLRIEFLLGQHPAHKY